MSINSPLLLVSLLAACGIALSQQTPDKSEKKLVDINNAPEVEIAALPEVGLELAKKIVKNRPYANIDDLARAGVPPATQDLIRNKIQFGRALKETPKAEGGRIAGTPGASSGIKSASTGSSHGSSVNPGHAVGASHSASAGGASKAGSTGSATSTSKKFSGTAKLTPAGKSTAKATTTTTKTPALND